MIQEENAVWVSIKTSQRILDLIVEKGLSASMNQPDGCEGR